ncbi:SixA phosphatase family protein [Nocardioides solisilvae]|uniref:SixA phosphatase family protein n=1 Tax=Nocardioides solisilvae TaxID=1542435 RepID=UPI000D741DEB|nr:histidine phosphatase family protein [Nocardioides solisilvae]
MTSDPRLLVLLRHASAESTAPTDAARTLTPRGRAEAAAAGRWLAEQRVYPQHALVSGAVRTRQTWEEAGAAAGWTLVPEVDDALYAAGPDAALDLVRAVPEETRTLLVLGHNPTIAYLAQLLQDGTGEPGLVAEMARGYPPATATLLAVEGDWADLDVAAARVVGFRVGRA